MTKPSPIHRVRIFSDFDGTISRQDVGDAFFATFASEVFEETNEAFLQGQLTAAEVFARYSAHLQMPDQESLETFLCSKELEEDFTSFCQWVASKGYVLSIVSDGLDLYIRPLLNRLGVEVPVFSNTTLLEKGTLRISSPYSDPECTRCGCCKRNVVATSSADEDILVYIGDGVSDFCAVEYVDIVYARGSLITWCQTHNISFRTFSNFAEIQDSLESVLQRRHFRKNHRAELARRALWMRG